jgi:hypothetical protein
VEFTHLPHGRIATQLPEDNAGANAGICAGACFSLPRSLSLRVASLAACNRTSRPESDVRLGCRVFGCFTLLALPRVEEDSPAGNGTLLHRAHRASSLGRRTFSPGALTREISHARHRVRRIDVFTNLCSPFSRGFSSTQRKLPR